MTPIQTERFTLRELSLNDIEALQESTPGTFTRESAREFVELGQAGLDPRLRRKYHLAIVATISGHFLGVVELSILSEYNRIAEIGFWTHARHQGQGIASEAARAAVEFLFRELGMKRVIGTCFPQNRASARVLEKAGLRYEGLMRGDTRIGESWRDSSLYAAIAEDFGF